MQYLTYEEYTKIGGVCELTAFDRVIKRACSIISNNTFGRIDKMATVPEEVKELCRDLVEYLTINSITEKSVSSRSQSSGPVSQSESYAVKSSDEQAQEIENLIKDYLMSVTDDNDTPLLYRGCVK